MRNIVVVVGVAAVAYAIDSIWFDGFYLGKAHLMLSEIARHFQ